MRFLAGGGWVVALVVLGVGTREARAVAPPPGPPQLRAVVRPWQQVSLFAPVDGVVREVNADIGKSVKKGDVLVRLAVPELEHKLQRAKAVADQGAVEVLLAKASHRASVAGLGVARAAVREAKTELVNAEAVLRLRQTRLRRLMQLLKEKAVAQEVVDEARQQVEAAQAGVDAGKARAVSAEAAVVERQALVTVRETEVDLARMRLMVRRVDVDLARELLSQTVIRSPIDGVVVRLLVTRGAFVRRAASGGRPLVDVHQVDRVRVLAAVPDALAPWVKVGDPVTVVVAALPGEKIAGKVSRLRVGKGKDRGAWLEVDLPNPGGKFLPGMTAEVGLPAPREKR